MATGLFTLLWVHALVGLQFLHAGLKASEASFVMAKLNTGNPWTKIATTGL
jgi:hypothetical protein